MVAADETVIGLGVVLFVAALAILLAHRLRQPMVLGYLVAGLLVGPHGPLPWRLVGLEHVDAMASLAIIFIMLSIGLEFSPRKLRQLGAAPVAAALLQMILMFLVGRTMALAVGLDAMSALFVGMAMAISSTIVAIKILEEKHELTQPHGRLVVGILLVEDIVAVVFLALIGGLAVTGTIQLAEVTPVFLVMAAFIIAGLVVGALVVPRLLDLARSSRELLLVVVLGAAFGVALLADHFHISIALGAFLVGAVIAESRAAHEAEATVEPLKHMFTAVFFISIGMLIVPQELLANWRLILIISAVLVVVRIIGIAGPAFLFGYPPRYALRGGAALGQVGEFSFIVLASGIAAGLIGTDILTLFVGVAGVTTLATPYLIMASPFMLKALRRVTPAPIRTYADVYTGWTQRLGEEEETKRHRRHEFVLLRRIVMNALVLFALGSIAYFLYLVSFDILVPVGQWQVSLAWLVVPLAGIVMVPFVVTLWAALRELAMEMILELVPDRVILQDEPPVALRVVRASLGLVLALGAAGLVVVFLPEAGPLALAGGGAALLLIALAGALLWRQIRRMHDQVEETMEDLFGVARTVEERDEVMRLIGRHYKVSLLTKNVEVPPNSPVAHRQIRDVQLRNRTGTTVVSIQRGRDRYVNPPPSMLILPEDILLLMGEEHHLERAQGYITQQVAPGSVPAPSSGEVTVQEYSLPDDSLAVGQTITGLGMRQYTGASIVAVLRGHTHIQNPPPNLVLQPDDQIFMIGTKDQVDKAMDLLAQKREQPDEGSSGRHPDPDADARSEDRSRS